jgi:carboxylesterase
MKCCGPIFIDKNSKNGILMLHGFSSTPKEFEELCKYMADKGFTVSAPVLAGHGTHPKDLIKTSPNDWLQTAKNAYEELKQKTENIFLIGNSFGSNLVFCMAKDLEEKPKGIIALSAPIFLRYHKFIVFRLYTYGLIKKYYKKSNRPFKISYEKMWGDAAYPVMPTKNLREFLRFIKTETMQNLGKIKVPVLVAQSDTDPAVNPKSATYIYEHLGPSSKELFRFSSKFHTLTADENRLELFEKIFDFINSINV